MHHGEDLPRPSLASTLRSVLTASVDVSGRHRLLATIHPHLDLRPEPAIALVADVIPMPRRAVDDELRAEPDAELRAELDADREPDPAA